MEIKKTPKEIKKPFIGYTVIVEYMHGDADFYTTEKYKLSNDSDLEIALKFFTTMKDGHFWRILSEASEYGSIEQYDEEKDDDEPSSETLINKAIEDGVMTREQVVRLWELFDDGEIDCPLDACGLPFVYRHAKVKKIKIEYFDGTALYSVRTEYNPKSKWETDEDD